MIDLNRYSLKIRNIVNSRYGKNPITKDEARIKLNEVIKEIYELGKKGCVIEDVLECDEDRLAYLATKYPMVQKLTEEFDLEII